MIAYQCTVQTYRRPTTISMRVDWISVENYIWFMALRVYLGPVLLLIAIL